MFRQPKKHAASTSSKGNEEGGAIEYLPRYYSISDHCRFSAAVIAPFNSRVATSAIMLFGRIMEDDRFSIVINGNEVPASDGSSSLDWIDENFIAGAEAELSDCQLADEFVEYLKKHKEESIATLVFFTGIFPDEVNKCVIKMNDVVLFDNVPVCSITDKQCCEE